MLSETQAVYELWEEGPLVFPPHSRLYHLEPIGVGSPMVESLTSYITRLAEAHRVSPYALFRNEICSLLLSQPTGNQLQAYLINLWKNSPVMNGLASTTNQLVEALERLTSQHDLSCLTMLSWKHAFSDRRLARRQKAWCPLCYEEWRRANQVIYEPLLWSLECVTACFKHATLLHTRCPYPDCACTIFALHQQAQSGFCPRCYRWLGTTSCREALLQGKEWSQQRWVNNQVGELLSTAHTLPPLPQDLFVHTLHTCVEAVTGGNVLAFARQFDLEQAAVWRWQRRGLLPQLSTLLWICERLEISPLQFLTGNLSEILAKRSLDRPSPSRPGKQQMIRRKRVDDEKVRQTLEACLTEQPPPSLSEVCRRIGHPDVTLYAHFAELCHAISQRYRAYQAEQREKWTQRLCDEIREAVYRLCAQGHYPSEWAVKKMIATRGAFRVKAVREAWKDILQERGLTR